MMASMNEEEAKAAYMAGSKAAWRNWAGSSYVTADQWFARKSLGRCVQCNEALVTNSDDLCENCERGPSSHD